jgi:hypothetical protein
MKKNIIGLIPLLLMSSLSSCHLLEIDIKEPPICVLTPDELSLMYSDKDSLPDSEIPYNYFGTHEFLQDSKDTILTSVSTSIEHYGNLYDTYKNKKLYGQSHVNFLNTSWCDVLEVKLYKDYADEQAEVSIVVHLKENSEFTEKLGNPIDTTLEILGKSYNTVYRFYNPDSLSTDFKEVLFVKKYGFVKIVLADGKKLELLK